jgi:hypothetical protein
MSHAFEFVRQPAGQIEGVGLSYVSSTQIKINAGYGESMGSYWEITPTDPLVTTGYSLSGLTTTTNGVYHYIYIDRTNSSFPSVVLANSTAAPTWSEDSMGWYNGSDRCIGAIWVNSNGAIPIFRTIDEETYLCATSLVVSGGAVTNTYPGSLGSMNTTSYSAYLPVNAVGARVEISCDVVTNTLAEVQIFSDDGTYLSKLAASGYRKAIIAGWLDIAKGSSRNFRWFGYSTATNNSVNIWIFGYRIQR